MSSVTLTSFRTAARQCTVVMRESADFIKRELGNVVASDVDRNAIQKVCDAFISNWYDIGTELEEMSELAVPDCSAPMRHRADRVHQWLGEDLPGLDAVVRSLSKASEVDPRYGAAYILVAESAVNVLKAFAAVSQAHQAFGAECERSDGDSTPRSGDMSPPPPASAPTPSLTDAKSQVHQLAMRFRRKAWLFLGGTLSSGLLLSWLAVWAGHQRGWEATLIHYVCMLAGSIALLAAIYSAALVIGSYRMYRGAIGSAEWYERDPQAFCRAYREVVGPGPW